MSLNSVEFPKISPRDLGQDLGVGADPSPASTAGAPQDSGFAKLLDESINKVNQDQLEANSAVKDLVAGRNKNVHETLLALEKADLSLKLMMQVRNKALDAYKEIIRMQV